MRIARTLFIVQLPIEMTHEPRNAVQARPSCGVSSAIGPPCLTANVRPLMRVRRSIIWFAVAGVGIFLLVLLFLPSGPHRQPIPAKVAVQGLSRPEAEYLYGHTRYVLRSMYWDAVHHLRLNEAWFRFQDARYSDIQSLTKNPDGSASIIVLNRWPGKPPYTRDMRTTGNWAWKETK